MGHFSGQHQAPNGSFFDHRPRAPPLLRQRKRRVSGIRSHDDISYAITPSWWGWGLKPPQVLQQHTNTAGLPLPTQAAAMRSSGVWGPVQVRLGGNFRVQWLKQCRIDFEDFGRVTNPWNEDLPLKKSRDGTVSDCCCGCTFRLVVRCLPVVLWKSPRCYWRSEDISAVLQELPPHLGAMLCAKMHQRPSESLLDGRIFSRGTTESRTVPWGYRRRVVRSGCMRTGTTVEGLGAPIDHQTFFRQLKAAGTLEDQDASSLHLQQQHVSGDFHQWRRTQ